MNQEDLKILTSLTSFVLDIAETQAGSMKLFSAELGLIENMISLRSKLDLAGDGEVARKAREDFGILERRFSADLESLRQPLRDTLSRSESLHEHAQALLATLKSGLMD